MSFFDLFSKKKSFDEKSRRELLQRKGRITEGIIIDYGLDANGEIVSFFYTYTVSGADYESSQSLFNDERARLDEFVPGARVTVRYDPGMPSNSVVV
jgi:hypothetical protein